MAVLPTGIAAVLAVTASQAMIICSDSLSGDEALAARIMACTQALGGAVAVVIRLDDLRRVLAQAKRAKQREHLNEMGGGFELPAAVEALAQQLR